MTLKRNIKFGEELTCRSKTDMRNLTNFDLSTRKSYFNGFLLSKVYIVWDNKVQKNDLSWYWEWCKIWRKADLRFGKRNLENFSPEHSKVSKLGLWLDSLLQSRKGMTLKFTDELCVMTMKNDTNIEEELTCSKIDMRNLRNFESSTQKSKTFAFFLAPCDQSI